MMLVNKNKKLQTGTNKNTHGDDITQINSANKQNENEILKTSSIIINP